VSEDLVEAAGLEGRHRHPCEPSRRDAVLRRLQADVDRSWAAVRA
jgi:hypothetical protein